jgi:hypothetical protein
VEGLEIIRFADLPEPEPLDTSRALGSQELTWERVLEEEPEVERALEELEGASQAGKPYAGRCLYVERHGMTPKAQVSKFVGWSARNPKLRSPEAYRLTMERMWALL